MADLQPWVEGPYGALDTETTGVQPDSRLVTATVVVVGKEGVLKEHYWLIDPRVEIPAEATAIHGITTERARAEGADAIEAAWDIRDEIGRIWAAGYPLVVFNAPFDLGVLFAEIERYDLPALTVGPVLDPLVLDRHFDRFRSGKDRLADCCLAHVVRQDDAHSSSGDALAAARLVWRMARKYPEVGMASLEALQELQRAWHVEWAEHFEEWLRARKAEEGGDPSEVVIEREWPVRTVRQLIPS